MSEKLLVAAVLSIALSIVAFAEPQSAVAGSGPAFGKWAYAGKDNKGLAWSGTLSIEKLDPVRFDATKYYALCSLEEESTDPMKGVHGVEAPCTWDSGARTLSFSIETSTNQTYTAALAGDGKTLTRGKWSRTKTDAAKTVISTGEWTAKIGR